MLGILTIVVCQQSQDVHARLVGRSPSASEGPDVTIICHGGPVPEITNTSPTISLDQTWNPSRLQYRLVPEENLILTVYVLPT